MSIYIAKALGVFFFFQVHIALGVNRIAAGDVAAGRAHLEASLRPGAAGHPPPPPPAVKRRDGVPHMGDWNSGLVF